MLKLNDSILKVPESLYECEDFKTAALNASRPCSGCSS